MDFVDRNELKAEVTKCKEAGKLSEELALMAVAIGRGYNKKFKVIIADEMDSVSMFVIVRVWMKINPACNVFNYLTSCIANELRQMRRTNDNFLKLKAKIKRKLLGND